MATIMIIDDDRDFLDDFASELGRWGFSVVARETTDGAIDELLRTKPALLVLDVMFPENPAGGFDLAREIRANGALEGMAILLLTAINQELPTDFSKADIDSEWFPVDDMIEKPADMRLLRARIEELLARGTNDRA